MSSKAVRVGMLGMGTVGGGVAELLQKNGGLLQNKTETELILQKVLVRDISRQRAVDLPSGIYTVEAADILLVSSIELVIELIGGIEPARTYILEALRRGKFVVTANKDLMARHGAELLEEARRHNRNIFYEAGVGGGIPLIHPMKYCLIANRITRIVGIINGTTNYILTRMTLEGMSFDDALREAQEKGFAETNPANDLEGLDTAYKLAILAGIAFNSVIDVDSIHVEGIKSVSGEDIRYARELGYTIKLLAIGESLGDGPTLRVHPALVPLTHPLAGVLYEYNAVFMEGDAVGEVMFYGRGAGALPTAGAVVADALEAARCLHGRLENGVMETRYQKNAVFPITSLASRFFLRLQAIDRPGVFGALATAFGDERVSLDMIIQKRSEEGIAEIVLVTNPVLEERFNRAMERIRQMDSLEKINSVFRVLG